MTSIDRSRVIPRKSWIAQSIALGDEIRRYDSGVKRVSTVNRHGPEMLPKLMDRDVFP